MDLQCLAFETFLSVEHSYSKNHPWLLGLQRAELRRQLFSTKFAQIESDRNWWWAGAAWLAQPSEDQTATNFLVINHSSTHEMSQITQKLEVHFKFIEDLVSR